MRTEHSTAPHSTANLSERDANSPGALDERGGRRAPADHVLLPLVRLHFEREAAAQNALHTPEHTMRWDEMIQTYFRYTRAVRVDSNVLYCTVLYTNVTGEHHRRVELS